MGVKRFSFRESSSPEAVVLGAPLEINVVATVGETLGAPLEIKVGAPEAVVLGASLEINVGPSSEGIDS